MRNTYVQVDQHGNVVKKMSNSTPPEDPRWIPVEDVGDLWRPDSKKKLVDGKLIDRPKIRILTSKDRFNADGRDHFFVTVSGLPPEMEDVNVVVGGRPVRIKEGEQVRVTSSGAGVLRLEIDDPVAVHQGRAKYVTANVPRERNEQGTTLRREPKPDQETR